MLKPERVVEIANMNLDELRDMLDAMATAHVNQAIEGSNGITLQCEMGGQITGRFCHCGTCTEALMAGLRFYLQLRENQCSLWVAQIMEAMSMAHTAWQLIGAGFPTDDLLYPMQLSEERFAYIRSISNVAHSLSRNVCETFQSVVMGDGEAGKEFYAKVKAGFDAKGD